MTLTKISLAVAVIFLMACAFSVSKPTTYFESDPMRYVCDRLEIVYNQELDCSELADPIIIVTALVDHFRAVGLYIEGEDYIFVSPTTGLTTVIHEWAHYVQSKLDLTHALCESEYAARVVAGQDPEEWRERYDCAQ